MSSSLHLTLNEYSQMVACGAFDAIGRNIELIRGEILEMNPAGPVQCGLECRRSIRGSSLARAVNS